MLPYAYHLLLPRGCLAAALIVCAAIASAQDGAIPPAPAQPQTPPATLPTPTETIGAIGRFINQSITNVGAGMKGAGDAVGDAASTAGDLARGVGDAAGTVARLPLSGTVSGWQPCPVAANGAPDCEAASHALCRTKGFTVGKSVDITSAQKCPAAVWLEKRQPTAAECPNESFVSKALCQ
jgi:hypothetical protein